MLFCLAFLKRSIAHFTTGPNFRPNPYRMQDAMHNVTQANEPCWCEWGCPHCRQATSKEKHSNLRARRVPRPVWIGPYKTPAFAARIADALSTLCSPSCLNQRRRTPSNTYNCPEPNSYNISPLQLHNSLLCSINPTCRCRLHTTYQTYPTLLQNFCKSQFQSFIYFISKKSIGSTKYNSILCSSKTWKKNSMVAILKNHTFSRPVIWKESQHFKKQLKWTKRFSKCSQTVDNYNHITLEMKKKVKFIASRGSFLYSQMERVNYSWMEQSSTFHRQWTNTFIQFYTK